MIAAYLIEPGRSAYLIDDLAAEYGVEIEPEPPAEETTATLVRHAEATRRLAAPMRERLRRAWLARPVRAHRAPPHGSPRGDGGRRREDRHVPHGRDHCAPPRPRGRARGARDRPRGRGVHARLDAAGGADPVRAARPRARAEGKDRLLDRQPGSPRASRSARARAGDRGVARVLEAAEHLPAAAAVADLRARRPPAHDVQPGGGGHGAPLDLQSEPAVDSCSDRPRPSDPLGVHRRGRAPAALGRLQPGRAAHPGARLRRAGAP